ncbi:MAG TPA: hypothetical protein DCY93_01635 [Firmicutes bacterium]|nr:hypothetical protein [Bacillota bacterium]
MNPWTNSDCIYTIIQLLLGNNSISNLEIVSSLNSFNLAYFQYHYFYGSCHSKYNPKIYLGTIQTTSYQWNYDGQTGQTNGLPNLPEGGQKSGSWQKKLGHFCPSYVLKFR